MVADTTGDSLEVLHRQQLVDEWILLRLQRLLGGLRGLARATLLAAGGASLAHSSFSLLGGGRADDSLSFDGVGERGAEAAREIRRCPLVGLDVPDLGGAAGQERRAAGRIDLDPVALLAADP